MCIFEKFHQNKVLSTTLPQNVRVLPYSKHAFTGKLNVVRIRTIPHIHHAAAPMARRADSAKPHASESCFISSRSAVTDALTSRWKDELPGVCAYEETWNIWPVRLGALKAVPKWLGNWAVREELG